LEKEHYLRLYDGTGKVVIDRTPAKNENTELNVSQLSGGLYFLEIREAGSQKTYTKKVLIARQKGFISFKNN
jgi:Secretion system C-terminal sorting domain